MRRAESYNIQGRAVKLIDQEAAEKDTLGSVSHDAQGNSGTSAHANEERQKTKALTQNRTLKMDNLMERVVDPNNLNDAYRRVVSNKGAPGIDRMMTKSSQNG